MVDYSRKIFNARNEKEMSLARLSELTGIAKSTLQRYETGITKKIPLDAIERIENALSLPLGTLLGVAPKQKSRFFAPRLSSNTVKIPVIGDIAAGYETVVSEDWTGETIEIPTSYLSGRKTEDFIVLRVKGDSMYPLYHDGDKVLILKQSTLNRSGEIGAVLYSDELVTIKKVEFVKGEDWLDLIPINPEFMPRRIEGEELEHCKVIGIPKLLIREF
ncbi:MAG: helix-turn-helix domain-containing protein [Clostridia bacterium]|nr:helix-turn-helix domain-containing protein [Clostridia bacterium]